MFGLSFKIFNSKDEKKEDLPYYLDEILKINNNNPFEKYKKERHDYPALNKIVFNLDINYDKIKKLSKIPVEIQSKSLCDSQSSYVFVSYKEYIKVYESTTLSDVRTKILELRDEFKGMPKNRQEEASGMFLETFRKLHGILAGNVEDDTYKYIIKVLKMVSEEFKEITKECNKNHIKDLEMEIDYLNKIKETREMFFKI